MSPGSIFAHAAARFDLRSHTLRPAGAFTTIDPRGEPTPVGTLLTLADVYAFEPVPPGLSDAEAGRIIDEALPPNTLVHVVGRGIIIDWRQMNSALFEALEIER